MHHSSTFRPVSVSLALVVVLCFGISVPAAEAKTIHDEKYGFNFELPDSAIDYPEGKSRPSVVYSYILDTQTTGRLVVAIEALGGVLARDSRLLLDELPPVQNSSLLHGGGSSWRALTCSRPSTARRSSHVPFRYL